MDADVVFQEIVDKGAQYAVSWQLNGETHRLAPMPRRGAVALLTALQSDEKFTSVEVWEITTRRANISEII